MNIRATAQHYSFLASCVTGYDVTVSITEDPSYVGYTSMPSVEKARIVLSAATPLYKNLSEDKKLIMMLGVLGHEALHLCYTNFDAFNRKTIVLSRQAEKEAFHEIGNVVEDMAIEFMADKKIGGKMLKGLSAVIKHTWQNAPSIEEGIPREQADIYAYTQVIRAMIQVGDRGCIKGNFLSNVARDAFAQVLPLMNAAVLEPDGELRVNYYVDIYKILLPLIRKESEEGNQSFDTGENMSMPQGMGEGEDMPGDDENTASTSAQIKQRMREELAEKLQKAASQSEDSDDGSDEADGTTGAAKNASGEQNEEGDVNTLPQSQPSSERPYAPSQTDENDLEHCDEEMEFTEEDIESLHSDIDGVESQIQITEAADAIMAVKQKRTFC